MKVINEIFVNDGQKNFNQQNIALFVLTHCISSVFLYIFKKDCTNYKKNKIFMVSFIVL